MLRVAATELPTGVVFRYAFNAGVRLVHRCLSKKHNATPVTASPCSGFLATGKDHRLVAAAAGKQFGTGCYDQRGTGFAFNGYTGFDGQIGAFHKNGVFKGVSMAAFPDSVCGNVGADTHVTVLKCGKAGDRCDSSANDGNQYQCVTGKPTASFLRRDGTGLELLVRGLGHQRTAIIVGHDLACQRLKLWRAIGFHTHQNVIAVVGLSQQDVEMDKVDARALALVDATFESPELLYQKGGLVGHYCCSVGMRAPLYMSNVKALCQLKEKSRLKGSISS